MDQSGILHPHSGEEGFVVNDFVHLVEGLKGNPWALPVFMSLFVAACHVAPVSPFPVAGGVLFGFKVGLIVNVAAVLIGSSGPFFIARRLGQHRFTRLLNHWHNRGVAARLRHPSPWGLVLLRLVGFPPFVVANYLLGLSHVPFRRFLWTTALGVLPSLFLFTFFSTELWTVLSEAGMSGFGRAVSHHARPLLAAALGMTSLVALGMWMNRRSDDESKEARN